MEEGAIRGELDNIQAEIKSVKPEFTKRKQAKESYFQKGKDFSSEIDKLYDQVKKIEEESGLDQINKELDEQKAEQEALKKELAALEDKFLLLKDHSQKKNASKKTLTTDKLKKDIKRLDLKLQTQVLSLNEESDVIKKIDELKELMKGKSESSDLRSIKRQINAVKRKYLDAERGIRSLYKRIRLISKEKKKRYKQIDTLKGLKKESMGFFKGEKKEYAKLGKKLKSLFKKEEEILAQLGESPSQKKKVHTKNIKAKQKEVEEKLMKKGQVLTTEDLLMFQK